MATEVMEVIVVATEAIEAMGDMEVMVATVEAMAEVMEVTVEATEAMADTDTANDLQMPSPNPSLRPATVSAICHSTQSSENRHIFQSRRFPGDLSLGR